MASHHIERHNHSRRGGRYSQTVCSHNINGSTDADLLAGVAGIGGTACVMLIENGKKPERLATENNYGLPVTVCPSHPHVVPCPSDLQP